MPRILWFVHWTESENSPRTTDCRLFFSFREAKKFMSNKRGYIFKYHDHGKMFANDSENSFKEYCNGFIPSAQEYQMMCAMMVTKPPVPESAGVLV